MCLKWIYGEGKHTVVESCLAGTALDFPGFEIITFTCSSEVSPILDLHSNQVFNCMNSKIHPAFEVSVTGMKCQFDLAV